MSLGLCVSLGLCLCLGLCMCLASCMCLGSCVRSGLCMPLGLCVPLGSCTHMALHRGAGQKVEGDIHGDAMAQGKKTQRGNIRQNRQEYFKGRVLQALLTRSSKGICLSSPPGSSLSSKI